VPLAGLGHSVASGPIAVVPSDITGEMSPNMLPPARLPFRSSGPGSPTNVQLRPSVSGRPTLSPHLPVEFGSGREQEAGASIMFA